MKFIKVTASSGDPCIIAIAGPALVRHADNGPLPPPFNLEAEAAAFRASRTFSTEQEALAALGSKDGRHICLVGGSPMWVRRDGRFQPGIEAWRKGDWTFDDKVAEHLEEIRNKWFVSYNKASIRSVISVYGSPGVAFEVGCRETVDEVWKMLSE
jgi:hypothetical protein